MKIPKKFQNEYRKATYEETTFHVGNVIRSFGTKGTILKVCATGAYVQFRGYEAEVAWGDMKIIEPSETSALPEHVRPTTKHPATPTRRGVVKSRTDVDCETQLLHERQELVKKDETIRDLEIQIAKLANENETLQIECREEKGSETSVSPDGKVVPESEKKDKTISFEIAGGNQTTIQREVRDRKTVILIAPRNLSFDEIDFERNVQVVYPVSRSIKWIANDAWNRGFRDTEYTIYQYVAGEHYTYEYSIDGNQTVEKITVAEKPKAAPVEIRSSDSCRVEIVAIKGRDSVRIIFAGTPSKDAMLSLKSQGFRYYSEKSTGLKYWGAFFTSELLRFAKEFCGNEGQETETAPSNSPSTQSDTHMPTPDSDDTEQETENREETGNLPDYADAEMNDEETSDESASLDKAEASMSSIEALLREALKK